MNDWVWILLIVCIAALIGYNLKRSYDQEDAYIKAGYCRSVVSYNRWEKCMEKEK